MEHQDLKVIVLRKEGKELKKIQQKRGDSESVSKNTTPQLKKDLDDNLESFNVNTVSFSLKTQIQKARVASNFSQKELAQKINVTQKIIQSYENGTAIPDPQILQKLRRILKVKFTK